MIKETVDAVRVAEMEADKVVATAKDNAMDKKAQIKTIHTIKAAIIYIYSFFKNNRIDSIRPKARPVMHRLRHFSNCFI